MGKRIESVLGEEEQIDEGYESYMKRKDKEDREGSSQSQVEKVLAERKARYGKFEDNAAMAQTMKDMFREQPIWQTLSVDKKEALDNIAQKLARILTGNNANYADSWVDICGYSKLVADALED